MPVVGSEGAKQAAMLEIYQYNPRPSIGGMVLVDIVVGQCVDGHLIIYWCEARLKK